MHIRNKSLYLNMHHHFLIKSNIKIQPVVRYGITKNIMQLMDAIDSEKDICDARKKKKKRIILFGSYNVFNFKMIP